MSSKSPLDPVPYPEVAKARDRILRFVLEMSELARLRQTADSISIRPSASSCSFVTSPASTRSAFRYRGWTRWPHPFADSTSQASAPACQQITTKLVAWCILHRVEPSLDALAAMRAAALRNVGLAPRLAA